MLHLMQGLHLIHVTVSSKTGEAPITTSTAKSAECNPHAEWKTTSVVKEDYIQHFSSNDEEKSGTNQALTLLAPEGMAEDLTKVQLILCKEVKSEIQAVKKTMTAIPFKEMQKSLTEATIMLEERMNNLED